jgi:hypothetical protein
VIVRILSALIDVRIVRHGIMGIGGPERSSPMTKPGRGRRVAKTPIETAS